MKYLSLFSGIGGFEVAIHKVFPDAECIGYSEVKPNAIKVYQSHFPDHKNLGDITEITEEITEEITSLAGKECDLLVAGFPCTNLSSMARFQGDSRGLKGNKSKLFYDMLRIIQFVNPKYIIIENNYSMSKSNRNKITKEIQNLFDTKIYTTMIDGKEVGIQSRKRVYWTNFHVNIDNITCEQNWDDVLENIEDVEQYFLSDKMILCLNRMVNCKGKAKAGCMSSRIAIQIDDEAYEFKEIATENAKTRWDITPKSDTNKNKSQTFVGSGGGGNNILIDRRYPDGFFVRRFSPTEVERLFFYQDGYTDLGISKTSRYNLLGNSVITKVIEYICISLKNITQ